MLTLPMGIGLEMIHKQFARLLADMARFYRLSLVQLTERPRDPMRLVTGVIAWTVIRSLGNVVVPAVIEGVPVKIYPYKSVTDQDGRPIIYLSSDYMHAGTQALLARRGDLLRVDGDASSDVYAYRIRNLFGNITLAKFE